MDTTTILQLATILAVVGTYFGLYRLIVSQKDATIESLKQQIALMRAESESVAAKALDEQVAIRDRALERIAKRKKRFADIRAKKFEPDLDSLHEEYGGPGTPSMVLKERVQELWEEWYEEFREEIEAGEARRSGEAE